MPVTVTPALEELIRRLDQAVSGEDDEARCRAVKRVLGEACAGAPDLLDAALLQPSAAPYARRLVHRDPAGRYTVLALVWDRGQGTELHDHSGMWCVECVYRGRVEVTSFSIRGGDAERGLVQFAQESRIVAGPGESGALIPPFEYHVLRNPDAVPAVTVHVYGGEMTACHVFEPVEGGWRRRFRNLSYTA